MFLEGKSISTVLTTVVLMMVGYFLRFEATEVPEKKKGAIGVRGIRLKRNDELEQVYVFEEGTESRIMYGEREVTLNRLKAAKRDGTGTKLRG